MLVVSHTAAHFFPISCFACLYFSSLIDGRNMENGVWFPLILIHIKLNLLNLGRLTEVRDLFFYRLNIKKIRINWVQKVNLSSYSKNTSLLSVCQECLLSPYSIQEGETQAHAFNQREFNYINYIYTLKKMKEGNWCGYSV